jgi:hypothetical protein
MTAGPDHAAARMMALFTGHPGAHGTHGEPVQDGLKWAIKTTARTLREPVTLALWESHLSGQRPLGVIPIREDSTCSWGSIDIDVYDADLLGVVSRIQEMGLPLVPCRSKSGGLHLFLFLSEPQPAALVRAVLKDVTARLGMAKRADGTTDTEIFPVQSQVLTERRDVGNWMVMPYFGGTYGGKLREQAGVKKTGAEQTLDEFLDLAEHSALTPEQLAALTAPPPSGKPNGATPPARPFADGPVCLEHMTGGAARLADGRKRTLFMMGLYFKRADPANWKRRVEDANAKFFEPPLPSEEVTGVYRSLSRKEYQYTCAVEPMAAHCDGRRCAMRRHGVGRGGAFPVITGLSKLDTDPPVWFLDVDGMRIEASTEQLLSYARMQELFAAHGNRFFRVMKQGEWADALVGAQESLVVLEAPPDAGSAAQFHEVLEDFLVNRWRGESREDLFRGKPWEDTEGTFASPAGQPKHFFRLKDLQAVLGREGLRGLGRGQLIRHIQRLGGGKFQFTIKDKNINVWWVPADAVTQTPRLDVPVARGEQL